MKSTCRKHRRSSLGSAVSCAALLDFSSAAGAASLTTAARDGDVTAVRAQLAAGADANQVESDGSSALLWAAYQSSTELVALLLANGADPNRANEFGVTPLLQASRNGDVETMRALLDGGAEVVRAVRDGETPLMAAARTGNADAVQLLLERGSDPNGVETLGGQSALMWASAEGHLSVVDALLRAGADPNLKSRTSELTKRSPRTDFPSGGFTALMWAARDGQEAMVRRLVDGGADIKLTNGDGATAMMLAIVNDRYDMAATLLTLGADANDGSLWYAVEMRDAPTDWRARDGSRLRPDHPNSLTGLDLVERLLAAGADPNKPFTGQMHNASMCCDTKGAGTPFYRAAVAADVDALRLLIGRGADLEWAPAPVEGACDGRHDLGAASRGHGADLEWTPKPVEGAPPMPFGDTTGLTPLMVAINGGKGLLMAGGPGDIRESKVGIWREPGDRDPANAVKLLLAAGANPNTVSPKGDTALHIAAHDGKLGPLRELVAGGADSNARDKEGKTALELVETMKPRVLDPIAEMVGIFDDGAPPAETAAYLRKLLAAR